jgi:HPt (histidine-containing phosphotransfer) domain-containing protein
MGASDQRVTANNGAGGAVDHSIINQLRSMSGAEGDVVISELATLFLQEAAMQLTTIATALDAQDFRKMQKAAHSLKSSSGNVGAQRFSLLCHQIEQANNPSELEAARAIARELRGEFVRVREELARLIKKSKAA